ncbi:apolipo L3-like protein [Labeo rohita]|uniref:Apolipo L3-like protein n=1 Tax=Labeo rohita TaxID=84645 RepID=A0A498LLA5_LABRO|nr:apolipo L3-like protein [Labeo rohita]
MYSPDLQDLIKEMVSIDPTSRPSADDILAKPFLREAVDRNKTFPQALEQRFMMSLNIFDETYNEHYDQFEALVKEWGETTDSLEKVHHKYTAGALSGSVIGAAGGITAVVGAILAPFTFGASLIVTGVGVGVGVAGGLTGAASSITNSVKQKSLRENIERIQHKFTEVTPILDSLNTVRKILRVIQKFKDFVSDSFDNVQMSCNVEKRKLMCASELMNLGLLANVGRIAAQTARVGRAAAAATAAVTGVLSGILVIVDTVFIVKDSIDIHRMRQGKVDNPKKVKSSLLKSIAVMRKTHKDRCDVLKEIKETRKELKDYIEMARERDLNRDWESLNL